MFLGGCLHRAALGLALCAALAQFLVVAHLLLVPHAMCAEHGELVHVDAADVTIASVEPPVSAATARAAYRASRGGAARDHHEHCAVSALRDKKLLVAQAQRSYVSQGSAAGSCAACTGNVVSLQSAVILRFAPKSSPPALRA